MKGEAFHLVTELGECRRSGCTGKASADHEHGELPLVCGVHELHVELVAGPTILDGT